MGRNHQSPFLVDGESALTTLERSAEGQHGHIGTSWPQAPENRAVGLWDPGSQAFVAGSLRRAIIARGWTLYEFAAITRLNVTSVHNAVNGRRVRDTTAIRIFEALEKRPPMGVAIASA